MHPVLQQLGAEHRDLRSLLALLRRQPSLLADPLAPNIGLLVDALSYLTSFPDVRHHPLEDRLAERLLRRDAIDPAFVGRSAPRARDFCRAETPLDQKPEAGSSVGCQYKGASGPQLAPIALSCSATARERSSSFRAKRKASFRSSSTWPSPSGSPLMRSKMWPRWEAKAGTPSGRSAPKRSVSQARSAMLL